MDVVPAMGDAGHVGFKDEAGATAHAGVRQAARELMNVAGRIGRCEEASVIGAVDGRLDLPHLLGRAPSAVETTFAQKVIDPGRCFIAGFVPVDV